MHGKKSFKGESKTERNGKNTAKLLKYYTLLDAAAFTFSLPLYKLSTKEWAYYVYRRFILWLNIVYHEEFRQMPVSFTCILYMCVTLFT